MIRFSLSSLIASGLLAACASPYAGTPDDERLCDFESNDISAWYNLEPSIDNIEPDRLIAVVELEDDGISRRLEKSGVSDGVARFDVVEWGPEEGRGKAVFRGKGEGATSLQISCNGEEIVFIEEIDKVY